jgi:hypothetical protein
MKALAILTIFSLLVAPAGFAQENSRVAQTWNALGSIKPGQKLQIETKDNNSIKGRLESASGSNLKLTVNGKALVYQSDQIKRVYLLRGRSIGKRMLVGAAVGAGGGAAIGAIAGRADTWMFDRGLWIATAACVWVFDRLRHRFNDRIASE